MKKRIGSMNIVGRLTAGVLLAAMGCSMTAGEDGEPLGEEHDALWSYGSPWPGPIPVCFDSALTPAFRTAVQDAVTSGWDNPLANVSFSGWGTCPATPAKGSVVVKLNAQIPSACISAWVVSVPNQVVACGTAVPNGAFGYNPSKTSFVEFQSAGAPSPAIAIHEFGHVLGFLHQMNDPAPGKPVVCTDRTSVGTKLTANDVANSIMATGYCNNSTGPSALDLAGALSFYRRDPDGNGVIHTYNTDPNNSEGDAVHSGTFLMCPGALDAIVGVEQWESGSHTIQCAMGPGWAGDYSGTRTATTTSTNNTCPDGFIAIGVDFTNNNWSCKLANNVGGAGTVSTSNQYGHFQLVGTRTEIHNCQGGAKGFVHGGNINFGKPIANQGWNFSCYNQ